MASQGAGNNGGQGAGKSFVSFSRSAAQRIAKAVRVVEAGNRSQPGVVFDHPMPGSGGSQLRTATFTGAWSIGSVKNVTYKYATGTANAHNDLMNLPDAGSRSCVIGREGTAWRLINWQWNVAYAATGATLSSTVLRFDAVPVGAVATSSTVTFSISATACTASS